MFLKIILGLIVFGLSIIYLWALKRNNYWKRQKIVSYVPSLPFIGNLKNIFLFKKCVADQFSSYYNAKEYRNQPIIGINIFYKPALLICEPELIKKILVKDFNSFSNRHTSSDHHTDALGGYNILLVRNPMWKQLRIKLSPIFSSAKMKQMFQLIKSVGKDLNECLLSETKKTKDNSFNSNLEIKDICARYATDVIASCAFGVEANCIKNPESEFRRAGRKIFEFNFYRSLEFSSVFFLPEIIPYVRFKVFSKETSNFLRSTINHVMSNREASGVQRNDLIDILIHLKKEGTPTDTKPINEDTVVFKGDVLVAQAAVFFSAGFDTTSSTISYALYELAKQPKLQERLRQEIKDVLQKNNGVITYENLNEMEYLEMIINETLRLYPALPFLDRLYEPQNSSENNYSLDPYSDYKIPRGMPVMIPVYAIQRDSKYFENPNHFDPERFSPKNKHKINPYTFMPFGTGPHNCIGERFGLMVTRYGLVTILCNHFIKPTAKTPKTIIFDTKTILLHSVDLMNLNIVYDPVI